MTLFCLSFIITLALIVNVVLWLGYHHDTEAQIRSLGEANRNLHGYIDELQRRLEQQRQGRVTKTLANKMTTHPAYVLHPMQPGDTDHFITTHLN